MFMRPIKYKSASKTALSNLFCKALIKNLPALVLRRKFHRTPQQRGFIQYAIDVGMPTFGTKIFRQIR